MQTVLVVDDEFGILDLLDDVLSDAGYRVVTASNGKRALDLLASEHPALVLCDYMMPILDGPATARAIRADPDYAGLPIVMMSAVSENLLRERFNDYQGYLNKPFLASDVLAVVDRMLAAGSAPRHD